MVWERSFGGSDTDGAFTVDQSVAGSIIVAGDSKSIGGDPKENHIG
jgi:hypothetical protein